MSGACEHVYSTQRALHRRQRFWPRWPSLLHVTHSRWLLSGTLYNKSLHRVEFPLVWHKAIISPIFIMGDLEDAAIYRLWGLHLFCVKYLKNCSNRFCFCFFTEARHFSLSQYDFLSFRFCLSNTVNLDFVKAFDSVNHRFLLATLKYFVIDEPVMNWIKFYLFNRSYQIQIDSALPEDPQGPEEPRACLSQLWPPTFSHWPINLPVIYSWYSRRSR